ncbi:FecR domain-containing protein [Flavobacterium sp. LB2P84]|uniref:FecR family protein n=1 Tax=Flavobacterium yafengii TaxID=3041253 RepID=UPI0024A968ED|nr:FecR domain-containing protein [Flavobacterium yafengii]MDI6034796.1 FecR domain-containing protein [Flavobacterium yafengii]
MQKEDFIALAQKYAQNKCSLSEKEAVETFFLKQTEKEQNTMILSLTKEKRNAIMHKINTTIYKPKGKLRKLYSNTAKIAAIVLICIGIPLVINQSTSKNLITQSAAKGEVKTLILPDGSQLVLNGNSSVTYATNFKDNRKLNLKGEAYFSVVRNPKNPFIVETIHFKTKVLGTYFTINAYENYPNTIRVLSGKVEVNSKENPNKKVFLTKNQQLKFSKSQLPLLTNDSHEDFLAWTKNIMVLENTPLGETAEILRNKFKVTILFNNPELEHLRISGKFKNENITTILKTIGEVKQLEIHFQTPNKILIREKPKN